MKILIEVLDYIHQGIQDKNRFLKTIKDGGVAVRVAK